jgi:hypothetical protein
MNRDKLESFVNENRHEFDNLEPSDKTWETISNRLNEQPVRKIRNWKWLKIAAFLVFALLLSSIVYQSRFVHQQQSAKAVPVDPEVQELMEAEAYYAQEVSGKMNEIQKCYKIHPELKQEIESDLNELDTMYHSLKNDLNDNISNKEVIEAMIENNRIRLKLVDDILEQVNC